MRKLLADERPSLEPTGNGRRLGNIEDMRWKKVSQMLSMMRKKQIDPRSVRIHIDGSDEAEVRDFLSVVEHNPEALRGFILRASDSVRVRIDEVMQKHKKNGERGTKKTDRQAEWDARRETDEESAKKAWRVEAVQKTEPAGSIFDADVDDASWPELNVDELKRKVESVSMFTHPTKPIVRSAPRPRAASVSENTPMPRVMPKPAKPKRTLANRLLGWTGWF